MLSNDMRWIFLLFFITWLLPSGLHAQTSARFKTKSGQSYLVSADRLFRDSVKGVVELTGHVQVVNEAQHLSCDHALVFDKLDEVEATGNIKMWTPTSYMEGEYARLNYSDNTGIVQRGFVQSGQVQFEGEIIKKLGPEEYLAERATYTTCMTCPPAWRFSGSKIHATMGGYAHISNAQMRFAYVPIPIWLPYLVVPLKSERQTGLLIPSISFSGRDGIGYTQPFFWAISRSQDATFTFRNYPHVGQKYSTNYRYVVTENSSGELDFGGLRDKRFQGDAIAKKYLPEGRAERWYLRFRDTYNLPDGYIQKSDINLVSDLAYPRDFAEDIGGFGDPALENRLSLTRNSELFHTSLDTDYYVNNLKENPFAENSDAVHRLPEIKVSMAEKNLAGTGLLFHFDLDYVNFARQDLPYDDVVTNSKRNLTPEEIQRQGCGADTTTCRQTVEIRRSRSLPNAIDPNNPQYWYESGEGVGRFNPNDYFYTDSEGKLIAHSHDIVRAGQRIDAQPELTYPIRLGRYGDLTPSLLYRYTQYAFDVNAPPGDSFNTSPQRQLLRGRIAARTQASAVYGDRIDVAGETSRYKHEIVPEVQFNTTPYLDQSESSFFGTRSKLPIFLESQPLSDSDFYGGRGVQFDYNDRISNRNYVTLNLDNKFIRKHWGPQVSTEYKQRALFRLSQSYDIDEANKDSYPRFPLSDLKALLDIRFDRFETNTLARYYPYHNVTNTQTRVRFMDDRSDYFQVTYSQTYAITENIDEASRNPSDSLNVDLGFVSRYINAEGGLAFVPEHYQPITVKTQSWNLKTQLKPPGSCWDFRFYITQVIEQKPNWTWSFNFNWGG